MAKSAKRQKVSPPTLIQILEGIEGIAIIIACYFTFFLKPLRDKWGLCKLEKTKIFPGDDFVPEPMTQFTHAVDIHAPANDVWCWIAQIGHPRGGFYSYELLENIAGLEIYNTDEVLPEFQNPKVGDIIPFSPEGGYPLIICNPGIAMAIGFHFDLVKNEVFDPTIYSSQNYFQLSWLWNIKPIGEKKSRFYSRNRITYNSSFKNNVLFGYLMEPVVFAMDRKMCLGIKARAEKMARDI